MSLPRLIVLILLACIVQCGYCDVIPENSHYVEKCVKIININDFDSLVLLGWKWFPGNYLEGVYEISSESCLNKGYKFNRFEIFAVHRSYIIGKDIVQIDWPNDKHALHSNMSIDPYYGYVNNWNPLNRVEEYYSILGFTDDSIVFFKTKEVFGYNNGSADTEVNYEYTGDPTLLNQKISTVVKLNNVKANKFLVYPNPAEDFVTIEISNSYMGAISYELRSPNGKIVYSQVKKKDSYLFTNKIPTSNIIKGTYFVSIKFGKAIETKKIIIK